MGGVSFTHVPSVSGKMHREKHPMHGCHLIQFVRAFHNVSMPYLVCSGGGCATGASAWLLASYLWCRIIVRLPCLTGMLFPARHPLHLSALHPSCTANCPQLASRGATVSLTLAAGMSYTLLIVKALASFPALAAAQGLTTAGLGLATTAVCQAYLRYSFWKQQQHQPWHPSEPS